MQLGTKYLDIKISTNRLQKKRDFYTKTVRNNTITKEISACSEFICPKILVFWYFFFRACPWQWLGWQDRVFANQILHISFWIKFVKRIPVQSENFGMKVYGQVYNDWVRECKVNQWCFVEMEELCRGSGDGNHVIMIFDSINHKQRVRISQFKIDLLLNFSQKAQSSDSD